MKKTIAISLFLYVCVGVYAQSALEKMLSSDVCRSANVSVLVKNLRTGETYATYRSDNVLPPASTMKLLTTATALEMLGADFRFETTIETDGKLSADGTLEGNLYLRGTGDPTLGSQKVGNQMFLCKWAQQMALLGLRRVKGAVVADMSFFDGDATNPGWLWEDIGNYYAPGIFSLAYMDNTMNVQLRSAARGTVAEVVKTIPEVPEVTFENHILCTSIQYDGAYVHGMPYNNVRYLTGSVPSDRGIFGVKGDLPNPGLLLARHFTARLREAGITVDREAEYITVPQTDANGNSVERDVLYTHLSEPLSEIVAETNINSNNLYAEQVFRYLGSRIATPTTIRNSQDIVSAFWRNRKIDMSACTVQDGCGLSPVDAMSASVFVALLTYMYKSASAEAFKASLPVAGESGTLRGFGVGTALEHRLRAKSGTTSKIKSYAGYIDTADGETLVFAVIVHNPKGKVKNAQAQIQRFLTQLVDEIKK